MSVSTRIGLPESAGWVPVSGSAETAGMVDDAPAVLVDEAVAVSVAVEVGVDVEVAVTVGVSMDVAVWVGVDVEVAVESIPVT